MIYVTILAGVALPWLLLNVAFYYHRRNRFIRAREPFLACELGILSTVASSSLVAFLFSTPTVNCSYMYVLTLGSGCEVALIYVLLLWKIIRRYIANTRDVDERFKMISSNAQFAYFLLFKRANFITIMRRIQVSYAIVLVLCVLLNSLLREDPTEIRLCFLDWFPLLLAVLNTFIFVFSLVSCFGFMAILKLLSDADSLGINHTFKCVSNLIIGGTGYATISFVLIIFQVADAKILLGMAIISYLMISFILLVPLIQMKGYERYDSLPLNSKGSSSVELFEKYIHCDEGSEMFGSFLRGELSVESLLFVRRVALFQSLLEDKRTASNRRYENIDTEEEYIKKMAAEIIADFVLPESPSLINGTSSDLVDTRHSISGVGKNKIMPSGNEVAANAFSKLYKGQIEMMFYDGFPRFLRIPEISRALKPFAKLIRIWISCSFESNFWQINIHRCPVFHVMSVQRK